MMNFIFTNEMIDKALKANGWYNHWHPDNWIHTSHTNPDWSGVDKETAFKRLLKEKNLI